MVNHYFCDPERLSRAQSREVERASTIMSKIWYFYLARCADQSLYAGITNDLERREKLHNTGKGSKYARTRLPVRIIYSEPYFNQSEARIREIQIKKWSRAKKEQLILKK